MIYKIAHAFQPEIFVPWCSIGRNIQFGKEQQGQPIQLSDGSQAEVISTREVHILSPEADSTAHRLYGISAMLLLTEWYKRLPIIATMFFVNIRLKKYEAKPDATAISAEVDTSGTPESD